MIDFLFCFTNINYTIISNLTDQDMSETLAVQSSGRSERCFRALILCKRRAKMIKLWKISVILRRENPKRCKLTSAGQSRDIITLSNCTVSICRL